jgi:rSAM/selenodomain-associated transferase 1
MPGERCVLLFVRNPEKGVIKSRLARDLGEDAVVSLYKDFVFDVLKTLKRGGYSLEICYYPPDAERQVSQWLGKDFSYMPQEGKDLGERMHRAFIRAFSKGFLRVLLIGSDIPDISDAIIDEAFQAEDSDAVLGPSFDGGYYLIGFRQNTLLPEIFYGMDWGTSIVYEKTMSVFEKRNYKVHLLPKLRDIDRLGDLRDLLERNRNTEFRESRTIEFIRKNEDLLS